MNIVNVLTNTAIKFSKKSMVIFENKCVSYEEVEKLVLKMANGLKKRGIQENTHVSLMMKNGLEYIISYFAILAVGGTVIPINPQYKEKELTYVLNNSESKALLYDRISADTVANVKKDLTTVDIFIEFLSRDSPACEWTKLLDNEPLDRFALKKGDDIAHIIYTSGTTGLPKGAMITHGSVQWMLKTLTHIRELSSKDRALIVAPMFHAMAKLSGLLSSVYSGATIVLEERFYPDRVLELIDKEKITIFVALPTMLVKLLQSPKLKHFHYNSLRFLGSGGASIPEEVLKRIKEVFGIEVVESYGQTEGTSMVTSQRMWEEKVIGSVGKPVPEVKLKIVNAENKKVNLGEVGEILFQGPNRMKGYYNKERETKKTIKNGWVYTGDLGYQDKDGNLFIVDRKKDMIIRSGYNVFPREIEEYLYAHSEIIECAVIGEPDEVVGEEIVAYVVTESNITEEELINYCKKRMANYKTPRVFRFVNELPKTATGKIQKALLKEKNFVHHPPNNRINNSLSN